MWHTGLVHTLAEAVESLGAVAGDDEIVGEDLGVGAREGVGTREGVSTREGVGHGGTRP